MRHVAGWAIALILATPIAAQATPILITPGPALAANAAARAAFDRAAERWGALLSDPVTVNINADLVTIANTNVIGQTTPVFLQAGYTSIRNQLVLDAADEPEDAIVAALPTAAQFSAYLPPGFLLTSTMVATKANLKAMGFEGLDAVFGSNDATIQFNSQFAFDYDSSDGVGTGLKDFESVALHEIGHALGFDSFVDSIDFVLNENQIGIAALEPLDLFRFGALPGFFPSTAEEFTVAPRMLVPGFPAIFDLVDDVWGLSTGQFTGDGRQASHWKDDALTGVLIGVMDPTLPSAFRPPLTRADLRALDVIGWDIQVPEPTTLALTALGLALTAGRRRERV